MLPDKTISFHYHIYYIKDIELLFQIDTLTKNNIMTIYNFA